MTITTLTSREFNQHASEAKKAAANGRVIITDRGRPAHVLLSIEDYRRLTGPSLSLAESLADPAAYAIAFEMPRSRDVTPPLEFE